jgi:hypothetical protein
MSPSRVCLLINPFWVSSGIILHVALRLKPAEGPEHAVLRWLSRTLLAQQRPKVGVIGSVFDSFSGFSPQALALLQHSQRE